MLMNKPYSSQLPTADHACMYELSTRTKIWSPGTKLNTASVLCLVITVWMFKVNWVTADECIYCSSFRTNNNPIIIIIIIIDTFIKRHKCLGYRGAGGLLASAIFKDCSLQSNNFSSYLKNLIFQKLNYSLFKDSSHKLWTTLLGQGWTSVPQQYLPKTSRGNAGKNGRTMHEMPSITHSSNISMSCSLRMYDTGSKWPVISISIRPLKTP